MPRKSKAQQREEHMKFLADVCENATKTWNSRMAKLLIDDRTLQVIGKDYAIDRVPIMTIDHDRNFVIVNTGLWCEYEVPIDCPKFDPTLESSMIYLSLKDQDLDSAMEEYTIAFDKIAEKQARDAYLQSLRTKVSEILSANLSIEEMKYVTYSARDV